MGEQSCSDAHDTAVLKMYSCIVDYACRHRYLDVIYEVSQHFNKSLSTLMVPHVRLAGASLYKMVIRDDVSQFCTAVELAEHLFEAVGTPSNHALVCCYAKLLCGLKAKALFHCLQSSPKAAFALLRKYFPRGENSLDKQLSMHNAALAKEIRQVSQDFRKCFLYLIGNKHRRETFLSHGYDRLYNQRFSQRLARRTATFVTELEKGLPDTFLDELLKGQVKADTPVSTPTLWDVLMELLLDCVEGKTTLQSSDLLDLLKDLRPCTEPGQLDIRKSMRRIRLMSSSDGLSVSSGSLGSQQSCGAEADSESTIPGMTGSGRDKGEQRMLAVSEGARNDVHSVQLCDMTSASTATRNNQRGSRTCLGCEQSRRIKLSAVRPQNYYGQRGTYVSPACHVKLFYRKAYQDASGHQHPLFT
ncbi:uncharacterized protein LOC143286155 [Babylonia areolata]|uniref:uncharacterized protein LOC143286155 n=1 Tax=Babylonia areolata TaxID=304850 RepID=UPI003FD61558